MDITDDTPLRDVHGMGSQSFTVLGVAGYNLRPNSTVGDFKKQTGSFDELKDTLSKGKMNYKYVLPKYQSMWSGFNKSPTSTLGKRKEPSHEEELKEARTDSNINFLLAPKAGDPDTSSNPEIVTNVEETPEVDAMSRHPREQASAVGDVAPKVDLFVIPDQTQSISPDDKEVNAPTLVLPGAPIPILPAVAIGPSVFASRLIAPLTHEEQAAEDTMAEELPSVKANGTKDIGGDGTGSLTYDSSVGPGSLNNKAQPGAAAIGPSGGSKFTSVPLSVASPPSFDEKQQVKAQDPRTASRHPFKQPGLFRDHDMAVQNAVAIERCNYNARKLQAAEAEALAQRDNSWYRWNAPTQGVRSVDMPETASNFLQRGQMVSDTQLLGVNRLQMTYSPSPFTAHRMLGQYGGTFM